MSLISMTNVAFARRSDTAPPVPRTPSQVNAAAHGGAPNKELGAATDAAAPKPAGTDAITDSLGVIVTYFPSEINILYTAIVAALVTTDTTSLAGQWVAFWLILALTPVAVWFVYAARVKADNKPLPIQPRTWPWAEIIVATIAFAIWAGALPGSPLREVNHYSSTAAGVVVLVSTTVLGWTAAVFQREIHVLPSASSSPPGSPAPAPGAPAPSPATS